MRLEENTPPAIFDKFRRFAWDAGVMDEIRGLVLIDDGWPWLSIRPNYDDLAAEGMIKFGPGPNTWGMKDTHTRLHYVCFGNAPGWLLAGVSARPEYEVIGPLLNEMLCEDYGGRVIASLVHCGDYWSKDPPGDPNGSSGLPGCRVLMGSFMLCHHIDPEQAANKHLLKHLIQDVTAFEKQSHLSIAPGGFAVGGRVVPASGHYLLSHKVMLPTVHFAEIANKNDEDGRTEQENWDSSKKRGIVEAKAKEEAGKVLICMEPEAAVSTNMASSFWDKLPRLFSASTKFVHGVLKLVTRISLKKGLVMALLVFKPQVVSSVNTCYSVSVVASPPSPRALIMAPPPPLPPSPRTLNMAPSRVTKRGARRLGPRSPSKSSDLTESKTEWGLPPKRSQPSCLPNC